MHETVFVGQTSNDLLSQVPDGALRYLETLRICDKRNPDVSWLEGHFTSFPRLRKLTTYYMSSASLSSLLTHCPNLQSLHFIPDKGFGRLYKDHLRVCTELSLPSLKSLTLHNGEFTPDGIVEFSTHCPPTLESLKLSRCSGITPTSLRSLLQLPLSHLTVIGMGIKPNEAKELKGIVQTEKSEGLDEESKFEFLAIGWGPVVPLYRG